jgi:Holliday junction resolvase RusA-like endonuclease
VNNSSNNDAYLHLDRAAVLFDVIGTPKPQGSMKAFMAGGHARQKPSGGLEFAAWRNAVSEAARHQAEIVGKLDGPLRLNVLFRFDMPKSRPKAARELGRAPKTTAQHAVARS